MRYLWSSWDKLKKGLESAKSRIVFLDFDGTLVPIAESPGAVRLSRETEKTLKTLASDARTRLVIVSGRPLKELKRYLKLKNVTFSGNHGLELEGRGVTLPPSARRARRLKHLIGLLSSKFKMAFAAYPGIMIEDKCYTLSVHFRKLLKEQMPFFQELIRYFKKKYKKYPLYWTNGKRVVEVRPDVYWGKGDTLEYLMKKFPHAAPIAVGDDSADEEMFRVLKKKKGLTVRVGRSNTSLADYYLQSPNDVEVFLERLCH